MFKIYKIYNNINNKIYIGQTKTSLNKRFTLHKSRGRNNSKKFQKNVLYNEMNKIGINNFFLQCLCVCFNETEADFQEKEFIKKYNSLEPNGYNVFSGGKKNFKTSLDFKKRISISRKKSEKVKRIQLIALDKDLNIIKKFRTKQECCKEYNIHDIKIKNTYHYIIKKQIFIIDDIEKIKHMKENQIVMFDKLGNEICSKNFNLDFEKEMNISNTIVSNYLNGKIKTTKEGYFFIRRKDITKEKINEKMQIINKKQINKIKVTFPNKTIKIFKNYSDVSRETGFNRQIISIFCRKKQIYKNYFFEIIS